MWTELASLAKLVIFNLLVDHDKFDCGFTDGSQIEGKLAWHCMERGRMGSAFRHNRPLRSP
jgi:hypothetical protein